MTTELNAASRLVVAGSDKDEDSYDTEIEVSFKVRGNAKGQVPRLLYLMHCMGSMGCSRSITVEDMGEDGKDVMFYFDGDGADKIDDIIVNGKAYKDE